MNCHIVIAIGLYRLKRSLDLGYCGNRNMVGHIYRTKDNRLVKELMLVTMGEVRGEEDCVANGWTFGWRKNSHTQQEGAGSRHVENGVEDYI